MVTPKSQEKVSEVPSEFDPEHKEAAHWFYRVPCAGVTYYSFEERPTRRQRVEPQASDDRTANTD